MTVLGNFCSLGDDASKGYHTVIVADTKYACSTYVQVLNDIFAGTKMWSKAYISMLTSVIRLTFFLPVNSFSAKRYDLLLKTWLSKQASHSGWIFSKC